MRAVITVIGRDTVGIIARVADCLKDHGVNILDISQSVLSDLFAMIMLADISCCDVALPVLSGELDGIGSGLGLKIHTMHEDIFNSMHTV